MIDLSPLLAALHDVKPSTWGGIAEGAAELLARLVTRGPVADLDQFDDALLDALRAQGPDILEILAMDGGAERGRRVARLAWRLDQHILNAIPAWSIAPHAGRLRWIRRRLHDLIVVTRRQPESRIALRFLSALGGG